jgi:hypothetical protein
MVDGDGDGVLAVGATVHAESVAAAAISAIAARVRFIPAPILMVTAG